ncbi:MAG: gene transfer agent family protein [Pseudomonadota bacterium]
MANPHRGEIDAVLDGQSYRLCLTLGALAELESAFGDEDMLALAERFARGRLKARDAIRVLGAGLRGGGHDLSDEQVARMRVSGGASGFVTLVADLLNATFGADAQDESAPAMPSDEPSAAFMGAKADVPFPGQT